MFKFRLMLLQFQSTKGRKITTLNKLNANTRCYHGCDIRTDVRALCKQNKINEAMQTLHYVANPDISMYDFLLQACLHKKALPEAKLVHAHMIQTGFNDLDTALGNKLLAIYAKSRNLVDSLIVLNQIPEPNVVSWTAIIAAYAKHGFALRALKLFYKMQRTGVEPNEFTFASILPACAQLGDLGNGMGFHEEIVRKGFQSDVYVGSALIDMYVKCGRMNDACQVFDKMSERNVVSWNAMIAGYAQNGCVDKSLDLFRKMPERDVASWNAMIAGYAQNGDHETALELFYKMQEASIQPDHFTFGSVLASLYSLQHGEGIHKQVIKSGFHSNVIVGSALVDMYGKFGRIEDARRVFDKMPERDVVSWNSMIAGYTQNGYVKEALKLFEKMPRRDVVSWNVMVAGYAQNGCFDEALDLLRIMQLKGVKANSDTFASILQACANLAALEHGKEAHEDIIRNGFKSDVYVGSGLVNMYAKCGNIEDARRVFDKMLAWNVVSWNAMIIGYAMHGCGKEALKLFEKMQQSDMSPDQVTFVGVLSACCHAGLVDDGRRYFECMSQCYQISPIIEHYCCIVDLLGRAGYLDEAHNFINKMPIKPTAAIWGSLLAACRIQANTKLGEQAAEHLFELDPENAAPYVLLSNIYAAGNMWDDIERMRNTMRHRGVMKKPGCSWIEVNKQIHAFVVGH